MIASSPAPEAAANIGVSSNRIITWAALAAALVLTGAMLGPYFHDNDQASILSGGLQLARGEVSPLHAEFYQYDKQYVTYWLAAALQVFFPAADPVTMGNALAYALFWSGVVACMLRCRAGSEIVGATVACLLAPCFLQHLAFLGSATISAGFLFLGFAIWRRFSVRSQICSCVFFALAVGARADAVMALPVVAWSLVAGGNLVRLAKNWRLYAIGASGVGPLVLGKLICSEAGADLLVPGFRLNVFAAIAIFGWGAAAVAWLLALLSLAAVASRRKSWKFQLYYLAPAAGLIIPVAYYSLYPFTTRYWFLTVATTFLFFVARRGSSVALSLPTRLRNTFSILLFAGAILPIFLGISLPYVNKPAFGFFAGERFPTADGVITMGGYAFNAFAFRQSRGLVDYNQALWVALSKLPDTLPPVYQQNSMAAYYDYAERFRGRLPVWAVDGSDCLSDFRSLIRRRPNPGAGFDTSPPGLPSGHLAAPVTEPEAGIRIFAISGHPPDTATRLMADLVEVFRGEDFVWVDEDHGKRVQSSRGRTAVWVGNAPFQIVNYAFGHATVLASHELPLSKLHAAVVPPDLISDPNGQRLLPSDLELREARAVFPSYMSVRQYVGQPPAR